MVCNVELSDFLDIVFENEDKPHAINEIIGLREKARIQLASRAALAEIDPTRLFSTRVILTEEMFKDMRVIRGKFIKEKGTLGPLMVATLTNRHPIVEFQPKRKKGVEASRFRLRVSHWKNI